MFAKTFSGKQRTIFAATKQLSAQFNNKTAAAVFQSRAITFSVRHTSIFVAAYENLKLITFIKCNLCC